MLLQKYTSGWILHTYCTSQKDEITRKSREKIHSTFGHGEYVVFTQTQN